MTERGQKKKNFQFLSKFFHFRHSLFYLGYFFEICLAIQKKNSYNITKENQHKIGDKT